MECAPTSEDNRPLKHMLQLADVSGPVIVPECVQGRGRNRFDVPAHALCMQCTVLSNPSRCELLSKVIA